VGNRKLVFVQKVIGNVLVTRGHFDHGNNGGIERQIPLATLTASLMFCNTSSYAKINFGLDIARAYAISASFSW
jgi:hypothetical protein